ncbi:M28 family peptidase [Flavitalea sp. BT771]|uniref:M28 family peptidase n=1 Tax=Flavitalea sp. BT771 TaxID=3063329 RepID=UPI0026E157D0|nr:M28 family peptidase [Flavitalea sp. BT771]MDO6432396.1 M28 family peptidase [Flavitalea sp. BT771]MDV6221306.1 M28 family peptidase [Flavitalea sp. BT771]
MKPVLLLLVLAMTGSFAHSQTNISPSTTELTNLLKGNYSPSTYSISASVSHPDSVSAGLRSLISADSLKSYLVALRSFQNRNSGSTTTSATRGIGAARQWAYTKFLQYGAANGGRLKAGFLQFTQTMCSVSAHKNVIAVLPGNQTTDKSIVLIEAHLDSRCEGLCDISCNAFGADDDASGVALVMELARVLSQYTFKNTIVFSLNTGEEQGLYGSIAFATYLKNNSIPVKAVSNNDVSGNIFCGHTSSAPSCPAFGNIDSIGLRIFSLGGFNSPHKQWARYIKLEYKEQLSGLVNVFTDIRIMTPEDRTGRGGDHQPFSARGYTAARLVEANENGNASSSSPGYVDRQHSTRDILGLDADGDGVEDTLYVDLNYLARNALVNGNALAMAALCPSTPTASAAIISSNRLRVRLNGAYPAFRIAVRSATNDWDSVYTVPGTSAIATSDTITVPYGSATNFFVSVAGVDANDLESFFGAETSLTTGTVIAATAKGMASTTSATLTAPSPYEGIQLLQNSPNPFDEATMITVISSTDTYNGRAWINISALDGRVVQRIRLPLKKGVNEVMYSHGYGVKGTYICSLLIDGLPVQSRKMIFR